MEFQRLLITGGAGFVGSNLAILFKEAIPGLRVMAFDNLKRRGSELNLPRLRAAGVEFLHGDVRCPEDLETLPDFEVLLECSAEPSVQAGRNGSPRYVLHTNLDGTINCLEAARLRRAAFLLLSTSRVYPIGLLNELPFSEDATRFRWEARSGVSGFSVYGIAEDFSLDGPRSFYGMSKLACEELLREYVYNYGMRALINRCGILAGPWQMGKEDQGVVTLWAARHFFQKPLQYKGFGGLGKQVRDLLHIEDLFDLLRLQMQSLGRWDGRVYNVGGAQERAVSLRELTELCAAATGHRVPLTAVPETSPVDLRIYISDPARVCRDFGWSPRRPVEKIVEDICAWIAEHASVVENILG